VIRVRMGYGECVPTMLNLVVISGKVNLVMETEVSTPKKKRIWCNWDCCAAGKITFSMSRCW